MQNTTKNAPGYVRDAVIKIMNGTSSPLTVKQILSGVQTEIGVTPSSSVRSYLRLNTPGLFVRERRGVYRIQNQHPDPRQRFFEQLEQRESAFTFQKSVLHHDDCFSWIERQPKTSIHAVVTDPPYGLHEYSVEQQEKMRSGKGGVWRIPPSFDGHQRSPLPRFTTLDHRKLDAIREFFNVWAKILIPVLVPGANVIVASNPLVSHVVSIALSEAGLERRGEIIRLTMTMRGGDRPKGAHKEFKNSRIASSFRWSSVGSPP